MEFTLSKMELLKIAAVTGHHSPARKAFLYFEEVERSFKSTAAKFDTETRAFTVWAPEAPGYRETFK